MKFKAFAHGLHAAAIAGALGFGNLGWAADNGLIEVEVIDRQRLIGKLIVLTGEAPKSVNLSIAFTLGSADLAKGQTEQLDELGYALSSVVLRDLEVGIYGHTDTSGASTYNQTLSEKRAESVAAYLVEHFGLDPDRLEVRGYGEERLLDSQNPRSAANRRVEIVTSRADLMNEADSATDPPEAEAQDEAPAESEPKGVITLN